MKKSLKTLVALIFSVAVIASTMMFAFAAPAKVATVKVSASTYNTVTLTWSKTSGADGYEIWYYKNNKTWTKVNSTTSTSYTVKGLTTGTTYKFRVRAYDERLLLSTLYGSASATISAKPLPANVTGLKATGKTNKTLDLTWTKVSGASGYVIQYYKGSAWTNLKTVTTNSYTVSALKIGTNYKFRVRAYRTVSGTKVYSAGYSATVTGTPKLAAPTTVKVTAMNETQVKISWSGVTGATGYKIYNYGTKKWKDAGANKYVIYSKVPNGTDYTVVVRAYAKVGSTVYDGNNSAQYTFTSTPAKVTNLSAESTSTTKFTAKWSESKGATNYEVSLYNYQTGESKVLGSVAKLNATASGLSAGGKFRIGVRPYVVNGTVNGYGAYAYYDLIADTEIKTGANTTATDAHITWAPVADATKYVLQRYNPMTYQWENLTETTDTEYIDHIGAGKGCLYCVNAYNGSALISSTKGEVATKGVTLKKSNFSVKVTWTKPEFTDNGAKAEIDRYSVYKIPLKGYSTYVTPIHDFDITDGSITSYTFNLAPGSNHSYLIYAYPKSSTAMPRSAKVVEFTVSSPDLTSISSSDASRTAQLQMLVESLNRTKLEQDRVQVKTQSSVNMKVEKIFINGDLNANTDNMDEGDRLIYNLLKGLLGEDNSISGAQLQEFIDGANAIMGIFGGSSWEDIPPLDTNESFNETLVFENAIATDSNGKKVSLRNYLEPSGTVNKMAYLYNEHNVSAWKNGFTSVGAKIHDDGRTQFKLVLKQEQFGVNSKPKKDQAYYHPGFASTFDAFNFTGGDGVNNQLTKLGDTTIEAMVNTDGTLNAYKITYPFSITFVASATEGSNVSIGISMTGTTVTRYDFVR